MNTHHTNNPLTGEQRFALEQIVTKGSVVSLEDRTYLMVQVSPMMLDFLAAMKFPGRENRLADVKHQISGQKATEEIATAETEFGITLKDMIDRFIGEWGAKWTPQTRYGYEYSFRILRAAIGGDVRVKTIGKDGLNRTKHFVQNLPVRYTHDYDGFSIERAVEMAIAQDLPRRTHKTINTQLQRIRTLFDWAEREWLIDRNPTVGLMLPPDPDKPQNRRRPFTIEQLQTIFSAPLYRGCVDDERGYKLSGPNHPKRERFWIPLIALFSGMRLREIGQLELPDVKELSGIHCFSVTDELWDAKAKKHVKSPSAERLVPIHSVILKCGFLDYVEAIRAEGHTRVFPRLKLREHGTRMDFFSTWFNERFLVSIDAKEARTSFHSFRHTFRDALREADVSLDVVRTLGGWSRGTGGFEAIYGGGFKVSRLKQEIEKVCYPDLDLSHLITD